MTPTRGAETISGRAVRAEMTGDTFREAGHRLVDQIAGWLETMPDGPVMRDESPADVRRALQVDRPLPDAPTDARVLLDEACDLLFNHSLFNGHPRFFGYITAPPAPIGILADFLAAAVNPNVGRQLPPVSGLT